MTSIAILVNPMAGRDVRRVAARATTVTFETKRDAVSRIAAGADAAGVQHIHIVEDPFRLATIALQWMPLAAQVHVASVPVSHGAADTEAALAAFVERGVSTVVSLGGDGTHRAISRQERDLTLIPLSTGTNNVFPTLAEPTLAGIVAGLAARDLLPAELMPRCKLLHVSFNDGEQDVGVIDAAYLENDFIGNMRPFDATKLRQLLLTRAEPDAIGTSPIGGYLDVVEANDDCGLLVRMNPQQSERANDSPAQAIPSEAENRTLNVPLSPGFFRSLSVAAVQRIPFDVPVLFRGQGVLALDGDREHKLNEERTAHVTVRRDGPRVVDIPAAMRYAARQGILAGS